MIHHTATCLKASQKAYRSTVLQIRRGNRDNLGICHRVRLGGANWGANSSFESLCERTRLGNVLGNLAQAKTGSTQDPICIEKVL